MIKIEFSGSGDEVRSEMLRLLGMQDPKTQPEAPAKTRKSKSAEVTTSPIKARLVRRGRKPAISSQKAWTKKEAEKLFSEIKANAKRIIAELASKPEGYPRSELIQVLGLQAQAIRGQLSSVGFALRRMGGKPSPISRENVDGEFIYKLDPIVAGVFKQPPVEV
jgi:hypothetical protein